MKCKNHGETDAQKQCVLCQAPLCDECSVTLKDRDYCKTCLEKQVAANRPFVQNQRSTVLAFFLALIPGAGYMYLGLMNRGLQTMVLFFGTIFVANMVHIDALVTLVLPVLIFYSVFDTLQLARRMNQGPVEDRVLIDTGGESNWQNYLGYGLVILGLLALVNNFIPFLFQYDMVRRLISPLLIIAIGAIILYKNLGRRTPSDGEGDH